MPFFPTDQPLTNQTPNPTDVARADQLREILVTAKRLTGAYPRQAWANDFRLLRAKDQVDDQRIAAGLAWLAAHATDQYCPQIFNAKDFRAKFAKLEAAAQREANPSSNKKNANPPKIATKEAYNLLHVFGDPFWPENTNSDDAGPMVQQTLDNLRAWKAAVAKLYRVGQAARKAAKDDGTYAYMKHDFPLLPLENILANMYDPVELAKWWLGEVHRMAWDWEGWRGNLLNWAWTPARSQWRRLLAEWSRSYCGNPDTFAKLTEGIKDGHQG